MRTEIKKLLGSEKLVIGTDRVLKAVRRGAAAKVILAENAPAELRERLERFRRLGSPFEIEEAGMANDEFGTLCKKPFAIAAAAILS